MPGHVPVLCGLTSCIQNTTKQKNARILGVLGAEQLYQHAEAFDHGRCLCFWGTRED